MCCFCPGVAADAEEPPRALLPLADRLDDLAAPAAMWMSSRISASLCGQVMRRCSAATAECQDVEGVPALLPALPAGDASLQRSGSEMLA